MSALGKDVTSRVLAHVEIVYLDRSTSKWWNERRKADDVRAFCGWYWVKGRREAGPFKTYSAALRDAYYLFVLEREVPSIGRSIVRNKKA